jgi:ligand-binding sensor domain-containing protein
MLETSDGYLWIGTWDGLNRFDGYEIITYRSIKDDTTSLPGNIIYNLCELPNGNIWISTDQGLSEFIRDENRFQTPAKNPIHHTRALVYGP